MNANDALIFRERRITGGVLNLQYSTADYWHLWTFANVTSRLNELQLQSDPCVYMTVSLKNLFGCFQSVMTPLMERWASEMCNRGFSVTGWEQLHNHSGERSRIRQPLLKDTCILGTSSSKRSEQGEEMMLYIKRKVRSSLRIFDGRWSFCNYVHVANKAQ